MLDNKKLQECLIIKVIKNTAIMINFDKKETITQLLVMVLKSF